MRPVFQSKSNSNSQSHGHGQSYIVSYIELWLPFTSQSTRYFRWRGSRSRRERERDVAPVGPHSQDNKFINRERRRRPTKTSSLSENPSIRPSIREGKRANVFIPSARTEMNQLKLIELHRFSSSSPSSPGKKEKNTFITETGLIRIAHRLFFGFGFGSVGNVPHMPPFSRLVTGITPKTQMKNPHPNPNQNRYKGDMGSHGGG